MNSDINVVFMGTPDFAVPSLEAIYKAGYNVNLVVTQEDRRSGRGKKLRPTEVKAKALDLGLEVFQPANINDPEAVDYIRSFEPDFIVVAAYGQILKEDIINMPSIDIINVHASLLPKYRGAAPINWSIVKGEAETGITIMEIEKGLDSGDMILQEAIPIEDEDDAASIHDKLSQLGGRMIVEAMLGLEEGSLTKTPQDHSRSSYAPMLTRESGVIDWNKSSRDIRNLVRGFKPWPSAFTSYKGETLKIHDLILTDENLEGEVGEILKVDKDYIYIKTLDGLVKINELQFPGNRKMKTSDYLRGNSIEVGEVLK